MELRLSRGDLLQLDPMSNRGTMKLLPIGKKKRQKLVTGDDSGHLGCYEFKKGEPQPVFLARPFDGPVTRVVLGGAQMKSDKIFAAHAQTVVGFTKKGKEFFRLTSSLTETIRSLVVEETRIWTGCEFIYNLYDDGRDASFFMSRDQINDLLVARISTDTDKDAVLACQDGVLRIVQGSKLVLEIPLGAPVQTLAHLHFDVAGISRGTREQVGIVYGLENGTFGVISFERIDNTLEHSVVWSIPDDAKSPVTAIKVHDISKDHGTDIIIGRDDGRVQIYSTGPDSGEGGNFELPSLVFSSELGESVRSLDAGFVNSTDYAEVVVALFSGKIVSFTSEPVTKRAVDDTYGRSVQKVNDENRIKHLRKEVEALKTRVDKERERLKKISVTAVTQATQGAHDFSVNARFGLDADHAAYVLSVELQTPIDLLVLRSPVRLEVLDVDDTSCRVFVSPTDPADPTCRFLATCRGTGKERRLSLVIRTTEGEHGDLSVTVVNGAVPKAAKLLRFTIKPLSLQQRAFDLPSDALARPRSCLTFKGSLNATVMREWLLFLFELPPRAEDDETEAAFHFRNVFSGAISSAAYSINELRFESESASTIAIIKECVGQLATSRRVQLTESLSSVATQDQAVVSLLRLVCNTYSYVFHHTMTNIIYV